MSKLTKSIIILSAIFFTCTIIAAVLFFSTIDIRDIKDDVLSNKGTIFNKNTIKDIDEEKQESLENVNLIKIDISSGNVKIIKSEDELFRSYVKGRLYDFSIPSRTLKVNLIKDGGTLKFKLLDNLFAFGFGYYFDGDIVLQIPESYQGDLTIDVSSGKVDVSVKNDFNNLKLETSSGNLNIDNITSKKTNLDLSSGKITIEKLHTNELTINVDSGRLTIDDFVATALKTDVSSGTIDLKGSFITLDTYISSGTVNIEAKKLEGNYNIDISSGRLYLKLPNNASYTMSGDISSGSLKNNVTGERRTSDFETAVNGGGYKIKFDISSGYAEIN